MDRRALVALQQAPLYQRPAVRDCLDCVSGWESAMTHTWRWRKWLPDRFGQHCRIITTGTLNSALVEFADGYKVVTSRYAVRRL